MRAILAWLLISATLILGGALARAQTPLPLTLEPGESVADIGPAMRYARDAGQPISEIEAAWRDGGLSADFGAVVAAADPYQPVWALVELENTGPADGRPPNEWILASDTHGLVALDVFLFRADTGPEQLLAHDSRRPFNPADYSVTRLASDPVRLAGGERALLLVRMTFGATDSVDLSLETQADHQAAAFANGTLLAGFYTFLAACILIFAVFDLAMRNAVGLAYALLLALGLGFIAYTDQVWFRFLYPESPGWHLPFGLSLLFVICAHGFATSGWAVYRFASRARFVRLYLALAAAMLAGLALVFVLPPEIMAVAAYAGLVLMLAGQVLAVFQWDRIGGGRRPAARLVMLLAFLGLGVLVLLAIGRLGTGDIPMGWVMKLVYAVIALVTMSGLSVGLVDLRREHEQALEREVAALQKEARTTRDLLEAERNYSRARDLADRRRQQLATMSHDIKQPLASLRMTMEAMTREQSPEIRARLSEAFDYMQELAQGHLDAPEDGDQAPRVQEADALEPYPLSLILDTVAQMFREEAVSKGISLRVVPSSVQVTVPPLAMMRVVSNLVSNAVKYTDEGRVLAGVRRYADGPCLQVLDTGRGMTQEELARFREAGQSGEGSSGHGLGLAIAFEMAAEHGLHLGAESVPGRGTLFSLRIPPSAVLWTPP